MSRLPLYGTQGKFTFRLLAMALFGQAVILSFFALVARGNAIADGRPDDGQQLLWVGLGLAAARPGRLRPDAPPVRRHPRLAGAGPHLGQRACSCRR